MQKKDLTKLVEKGFKEIKIRQKLFPETDGGIKFWLKDMYMQGRLDQLELERNSRK